MIMITGTLNADPEQREDFLTFIRGLVPTERQKPGCLEFSIYEDVTAPNTFLMLEQWESREALDAHTESEDFEANDVLLASFLTEDPVFDEYEFD